MFQPEKKTVVYKDNKIIICADSKQYILRWVKKKEDGTDGDGDATFWCDLEGVFREILSQSVKRKIVLPNVDKYKALLEVTRASLLYVQSIANKIPYRILSEAPDVKVIVSQDYFDPRE